MIRTLTLAAAAALAAATTAVAQDQEAEESPFTVDVNASVYSAYMFRGQNFYDGMSFQPSITPAYSLGDYGNVSGLLWMHLPADGVRNDVKFFEVDEALLYDVTVGKFTFSAGHYWYTYPNESENIPTTNEFFGSVAVDTMLSPSFSIYNDYREFDYQYYELNLSHTIEETGDHPYNVTPFASFGFASNSEKVYADNGLEQVTVGLSTDLEAGELTIKPTMAYTFKADDLAVDKFWMGISATKSF